MPKLITGREAHPGKQGPGRLVATDEDLQLIHDLASQGKSLRIIALRLGVSYQMLDSWMGNCKSTIKRADPRVREAWQAGIAEHEDTLVSTLSKVIKDDSHRMQVPSVMFMLKAKHKWRESHEVEVQTKESAPSRFRTKDITPPEGEQ